MTFVVVSDIHGRKDRLGEALALHKSADGILFLGDGVRDLSCERWRADGKLFAGVLGNCDGFWHVAEPAVNTEELLLRLGKFSVMLMHGHRHGVKGGWERAAAYASQKGADLLLFGHTHVPLETYLPAGSVCEGYVLPRPLWVMNPGSLGSPAHGEVSYGLVQIQGENLLLSHGTLKA